MTHQYTQATEVASRILLGGKGTPIVRGRCFFRRAARGPSAVRPHEPPSSEAWRDLWSSKMVRAILAPPAPSPRAWSHGRDPRPSIYSDPADCYPQPRV